LRHRANLPEARSGRWGEDLTADRMKECRWLKPALVGQVEFVEWTPDDHLRHARSCGTYACLRWRLGPLTVLRQPPICRGGPKDFLDYLRDAENTKAFPQELWMAMVHVKHCTLANRREDLVPVETNTERLCSPLWHVRRTVRYGSQRDANHVSHH
jgi:hypothetical protein